jgi:hypothetical protein
MTETTPAATVPAYRYEESRTADPILPGPRRSPEPTTSSRDVSVLGGEEGCYAGMDYPGVRYAMERLALHGLLQTDRVEARPKHAER